MSSSGASGIHKRRHDLYWPILLTLVDMFAVAVGLGVGYLIRFHSPISDSLTPGHVPGDYAKLLPLALVAWMLGFYLVRVYRRNQRVWSWRTGRHIAKGSVLAVALFLAGLFFLRPMRTGSGAPLDMAIPVARWMVPIALATVTACVYVGRYVLHRWLVVPALLHGQGLAGALLLGVGPTARAIARSIRRHPEYGWRLIGCVSTDLADVGRKQVGVRVLGGMEEFPALLDAHPVEAVFVTRPDFRHEDLGQVFLHCQKRLVDVKVVPDMTEMLFGHLEVDSLDGMPVLGMRDTPLRGWNVVFKRMTDVIVSGGLLLLLSPLLGLLALLVKRDSEGPAFYRQERVGADGRHFFITKFRTMRVDAERTSGPVFSGPGDPRQTRVGRWLRQMHLDELPQLWNVLVGDMSLVGPRPERPYFVEQFSDKIPQYMSRHRIKSGMTGWAQVNGQTGHEGSIEERLRYDLFYIENWSFPFDLKVLLLTFGWLSRRLQQVRSLPDGHPGLRRTESDEASGAREAEDVGEA